MPTTRACEAENREKRLSEPGGGKLTRARDGQRGPAGRRAARDILLGRDWPRRTGSRPGFPLPPPPQPRPARRACNHTRARTRIIIIVIIIVVVVRERVIAERRAATAAPRTFWLSCIYRYTCTEIACESVPGICVPRGI